MNNVKDNGEVRKIQFTGRSTFILSLPKKWMEEMHLRAGDPVSIVREANNSLSIMPTSLRSFSSINEATAVILPTETENSLKRKVISMYLAGFNIVHLRAKLGRINPSQRDALREVVRRNLVGTEIIADSSDMITIQILLTLPELSVSTAVRRMFLIATSMHKDAMASLSEMNHDLAKEVIKSDDEVDRFSLYILRNLALATQNDRILREVGLKNPADCLSFRVAVKSIERIADHSYGIAEKTLKLKRQISKDLYVKMENMSTLSLAIIADSVESLLRREYAMADRVVDNVDKVRQMENDIISAMSDDKNDAAYLRLILEDIRRSAEYASDIAEAAMNQTIGEIIEKRSTFRENDKMVAK